MSIPRLKDSLRYTACFTSDLSPLNFTSNVSFLFSCQFSTQTRRKVRLQSSDTTTCQDPTPSEQHMRYHASDSSHARDQADPVSVYQPHCQTDPSYTVFNRAQETQEAFRSCLKGRTSTVTTQVSQTRLARVSRGRVRSVVREADVKKEWQSSDCVLPEVRQAQQASAGRRAQGVSAFTRGGFLLL